MTTCTPSLSPSRESFAHFVSAVPADTPIVMLNLLRFNAQAQYPQGSTESATTGRAAYAEYSRLITPLLAAAGAQVLWLGRAHSALIAPAGETWDEVLLVRYPDKQAFAQMTSSAAYLAIVHHRMAALADSRLVATTEGLGA